MKASKIALPVLAALVVAIFTAVAVASICNMTMAGLEECLLAVRDQNTQPPTEACCTALKPAKFSCFCQYQDDPMVLLMGIDMNLAMNLPSKGNNKRVPTHF